MIVKFPMGRVVATPDAIDALTKAGDSAETYLNRHVTGDWGNMPKEDAEENEHALREGFRLFSSYTLSDGTEIWIITEADRSSTTVLLPDNY
jgi:hypothetical protein